MTQTSARFLSDYKPSNYAIATVNLTVVLDDNKTKVTNEMVMNRQGGHNEPLILDGEQLNLLSVSIDDEKLSSEHYQLSETTLTIFIEKDEFTLKIETEIDPQANTALSGLFKSGDAFCSQCEAEGFRRISYYLDRPDVMATFTTKIIGDKTHYPYLLSNGNKIEFGQLADNKHFVTWHDPYPKPCYLFALVAGDFDLLEDKYHTSEGRDVALEIFVDKGNKQKAEHAMASLKKAMQWDEETFNLAYDLDIYMIVAVDFFNMGAMENKGLNVFNSKYVLADKTSATDVDYFNIEAVIAHEYFHNWTGNRVTCRDWFQLSLKEGLTVFRDQQFSADMHSSAVTRIQNVRVLRSQQFAEDAGPMSHPIRPEKVLEMNNFYTLTVYEKGAEVIRMMHTLLGVDAFKAGMALYFKRFDGMAVTCDDFVNAMADASGKDLTQFKRWYSQSGTPTLTVLETFDETNKVYSITLQQQSPITASQPNPEALHIPLKIELLSKEQSNHAELIELTETQQSWSFSGYTTKPTLALLADFTAPVKVNFEQDDNSLRHIIMQADNSFCRWDAGQKLMMNTVKQLTSNNEYILSAQLLDCFKTMLLASEDPALIAEQFTLPSFDEAAEVIAEVDPQALVNAINKLTVFIAEGLTSELADTYQQCHLLLNKPNISDADIASNRALKNVCLSFLAMIDDHEKLVEQQFDDAKNMTDALAALSCSAKQNLSCFSTQMQHFEHQWQSTTLVMDKWFALAATQQSEDIFEKLALLSRHTDFSLKNPNRARALIGAFAMSNPKYFHCKSGKGYQFLAGYIGQLNEINPQVASRLITPLIQFKSFAPEHQKLMKAELVKLQSLPNLSKDLEEKLCAALV